MFDCKPLIILRVPNDITNSEVNRGTYEILVNNFFSATFTLRSKKMNICAQMCLLLESTKSNHSNNSLNVTNHRSSLKH